LAVAVLCALGGFAGERPTVVVGIPPLKWVVESVAGGAVGVAVFLQPGQNPHTFEPSGRQVAELERAAAFLYVGLEVETQVAERLAARKSRLVCRAVGGLQAARAAGHAHGAECPCGGHGQDDPHVWLAPARLEGVAERCAAVLRELLPDRAAAFDEGLARTRARIREVDAEIREILKPAAGRTLLVYHPSWGLFAEAYGLAQLALEDGGKTPSARHMAAVVERAKREGVRVLFSNPEAPEAVVRRAARALGCWLEVMDPLAADWDANLLDAARRIAAALDPEGAR